jgi:drug/metabolite transporter (DMT)-like permease
MSSRNTFSNWALLLSLTLIWGTSYILIKKGLVVFSPIELASMRVSISMVFSLPIVFRAVRVVPFKLYGFVLLTGLFGSLIPAFLFAFSLTHISSSVNGIINSLSPLFTLLIGVFLFGGTTTRQRIIGVLIGFSGAAVLVLFKENGALNADLGWAILPVVATFCYGMSGNIVKEKLGSQNALYMTALAMLMIGIPTTVIALQTVPAKLQMVEGAWLAFSYVAILSILGTFIAWMLYYRLIQRTDALFASSVTYLIPLVAVAWGVADGERFSIFQAAGMMLILWGVWLVTKRERMNISK